MASRYMKTAKKLQTACKKVFGVRLLINQKQWYSYDKDMAITCYSLQKVTGERSSKTKNIELFRTYSQIQLVLFMRDYWYELNGWEVPHDNEKWEEIKTKYGQTEKPSNIDPEVRDEGNTAGTYGANFFD